MIIKRNNKLKENDGQNKQQSNLSVLKHVTFVKKDPQTHFSVELTVQINFAIGPVYRPLSLEGRRGTGLWSLAWVFVEIW